MLPVTLVIAYFCFYVLVLLVIDWHTEEETTGQLAVLAIITLEMVVTIKSRWVTLETYGIMLALQLFTKFSFNQFRYSTKQERLFAVLCLAILGMP